MFLCNNFKNFALSLPVAKQNVKRDTILDFFFFFHNGEVGLYNFLLFAGVNRGQSLSTMFFIKKISFFS